MIPVIDHYAAQSLKEFLNWKCLTDLRAFKTVSGELTSYSPKWQGKKALASPYAGFVYDAGISGAIVPTSLSGVAGAQVDYRNGRFIVPTGASFSGNVSFSVNEFNFYITSSPESRLIFETKPLQNPERLAATGFIPPDSFVAPCIFVKSFSSEGEDHCLGGMTRSSWNFKLVAMMRRESELLGIQKVIRDSRGEIFPLISQSVFNQYGALADSGWTYQNEIDLMEDYFFIDKATFKISELDVFTDDNPKMFVGVGNVEVSYYSTPRIAPERNEYYLEFESEEYFELEEAEEYLALN